MNKKVADVAIVGAGIVGLAHAYHALKKGYRVVLFEREQHAVGASIRNFGLLWPIGQEPGLATEQAFRARNHWMSIANDAGIWIDPNGSLQLAYHDDEWNVLNEFVDLYGSYANFDIDLVNPSKVKELSPLVRKKDLRGGLWSKTECTVNPREAIQKIPDYLIEKFGLMTSFGTVVTSLEMPTVKTSQGEWKVDKVIICSGSDFETLYPEVYIKNALTKCKLQMMKAPSPFSDFKLGPTLCAGLTLRHYNSFAQCPSLKLVDERYDRMNNQFKQHGIHVLIAQNDYGELIIGDSHHYGQTVDPFESEFVNQLILEYANTFFNMDDVKVAERWHGVYPKIPNGTNFILQPEQDVTLVNGLGGAGMTLSFGVAEEVIETLF